MAQGLEPFDLKTLLLNVSVHITTYNVNNSTSVNYIQEYVRITLFIISTFLYV
jgi:hypothetical protein